MNALSKPSSLPTLDYAARSGRARQVARRVACFAFLGFAGFLLIRFGPAVAERAASYFAEQRCATYQLPADAVVFDATSNSIRSIPSFWQRLCPTAKANPIAFLHERRTARGRPFLVSVEVVPIPGRDSLSLFARTFEPGTLAHPAREVIFANHSLCAVGGRAAILAGQPHPEDSSHFTIEFIENASRGIIDGWIDDTGYVTLERRP